MRRVGAGQGDAEGGQRAVPAHPHGGRRRSARSGAAPYPCLVARRRSTPRVLSLASHLPALALGWSVKLLLYVLVHLSSAQCASHAPRGLWWELVELCALATLHASPFFVLLPQRITCPPGCSCHKPCFAYLLITLSCSCRGPDSEFWRNIPSGGGWREQVSQWWPRCQPGGFLCGRVCLRARACGGARVRQALRSA